MKIKNIFKFLLIGLLTAPLYRLSLASEPVSSETAEETVKLKVAKTMNSFLRNVRPESKITLVMKGGKKLACLYSRSNTKGIEVWTSEDFDPDSRRSFYYSEIKLLEIPRSSFVEEDAGDGVE